MQRIENIEAMNMRTASLKINNTLSTVYIMDYDNSYIISIPDITFSMKVNQEVTEEELFEEVVMYLFAFMDQDESETASSIICSAIREI